jgi:3-deoxy-D-manno-octulosonic-acid transferase
MRKTLPLRLYGRTLGLAGPLAAGGVLHWRLRKGREIGSRLPERRGIATRPRPEGPLVWIHAASVGRFTAVLPLVDAIIGRGFNVLVTTTTLNAAQLAARRLPPEAQHQFLPLDVPRYLRRFFDHWRPALLILAETHVWPNLIVETERRRVPAVIVNGRIPDRSLRLWQKVPRTTRTLLDAVDLCLAQTPEDAQRFIGFGAQRVSVSGNLKFDAPPPPAPSDDLQRLKRSVLGRPVFLAAMTHPGEDELVMHAHILARRHIPDLLTIIAPRHPQRGMEIGQMAADAGLAVQLRTYSKDISRRTEIYVADTTGELGLFYRVSRIAFMGGSLEAFGGHSPLEAAKLGIPILHGPENGQFRDIYTALDASEGAVEIDGATLSSAVTGLMLDDATCLQMRHNAGETLRLLGGALDHTLIALEPYLIQFRLSAG